MQFKIRPSCFSSEWVVEVWEEVEGHGELSLAAFSGPFGEELAVEYVGLKQGIGRQSVGAKDPIVDAPTHGSRSDPHRLERPTYIIGRKDFLDGELQKQEQSEKLTGHAVGVEKEGFVSLPIAPTVSPPDN